MGQVDYKNTATFLLKSHNLDRDQKFKIACNFCLEEYARANFKDVEIGKQSSKDRLVKFWVAKIAGWSFVMCKKEGDFVHIDTINHQALVSNWYANVFYWALKRNNETAARYMWDNYRKEFNESYCLFKAVREAGKVFNANFMCYMLSQAHERDQENALYFENDQILKCLLDDWLWGTYLWADYYLPTLQRLKNEMCKYPCYFDEPLENVTKCLVESHESYRCNYEEIFKELWHMCPKEYLFEEALVPVSGTKISNSILKSLAESGKYRNLVELIQSDARAFKRN